MCSALAKAPRQFQPSRAKVVRPLDLPALLISGIKLPSSASFVAFGK